MLSKLNLKIIHNQSIALAVSGGSDSMAMIHMMHESGVKFVVLTVNHGLRSEASEEAEYVQQACENLQVKHKILKWEHEGITSNVHDQARDARYDLMSDWCHENNIQTLCTAHHMDDCVEHFLIRVSRGAGLLGLIDHEKIIYNGITIARPMFAFTKEELVNYLKARNIKYYEDRSNADPKYLRSNIRKWLDLMPPELDLELFKRRVIGVKTNLARASKVIQRIFDEEMLNVVMDKDSAIIPSLPQDEEIAIMMLSHILPIIGEEKDPPRMESMKKLYDRLLKSDQSKMTLSNCIIEKKLGRIIVRKENR